MLQPTPRLATVVSDPPMFCQAMMGLLIVTGAGANSVTAPDVVVTGVRNAYVPMSTFVYESPNGAVASSPIFVDPLKNSTMATSAGLLRAGLSRRSAGPDLE